MSNEAAGTATTDSTRDAVAQAKGVLTDAAARVQEKVIDFGRAAGEKLNTSRGAAADTLDDAALSLHQGAERASELGHAAANKVGVSARYIRDHDTKAVVADVQEIVRTHPGKSLLLAAGIGFLAARAFRRND